MTAIPAAAIPGRPFPAPGFFGIALTSVSAFALAAPREIAAGAAFSISMAKRVAMSAEYSGSG